VEAARGAPAAAPTAAATAPAATSTAPPPPGAGNAAPATTAIAVPAASSTVPENFGFRERAEEPESGDAPAPPEVRAKVAEVRETVPDAFLITLDNGQVWRQTRPDPYLRLRVGQDVRIYFSRWRAYRLDSSQMRGFLQVERVR
jgi:hypothetical protein